MSKERLSTKRKTIPRELRTVIREQRIRDWSPIVHSDHANTINGYGKIPRFSSSLDMSYRVRNGSHPFGVSGLDFPYASIKKALLPRVISPITAMGMPPN